MQRSGPPAPGRAVRAPRRTSKETRRTVTSAGPRSFSLKNITERQRHARTAPGTRAAGAAARRAEELRQHALFAQIAQPLPIAREVSGQKKHQQNLDRFHRLERPEVYFGIVAGRAVCRISAAGRKAPARRTAACSTNRRGAGNRRGATPAAPAAGIRQTRRSRTCETRACRAGDRACSPSGRSRCR